MPCVATRARLKFEWLPRSGRRVRAGVSYELYLNDPSSAAPDEHRTDLFWPVA